MTAIVRNKLVAEILGPAGVGLISSYNAAATLLSNSTNFGISFSAVRRVAELSEQNDEQALLRFIQVVRSWSIATGVLGMLVCCLFSVFLSYSYFENPDACGTCWSYSPCKPNRTGWSCGAGRASWTSYSP